MTPQQHRDMVELYRVTARHTRAYARFRCNEIALGTETAHPWVLQEIAEAMGDADDLDPVETS